MKKRFDRVGLNFDIKAKYEKGVGYEVYRRCSPHEVMMSFFDDGGAEAFRKWWEGDGAVRFQEFFETYEPTYEYQTPVIRQEIRNAGP